MAIFKYILIFIFIYNVNAGSAVVILYEVPMFQEQDINSKRITYLKKGTKIFIHDSNFLHSPFKIGFNSYDNKLSYLEIVKKMNSIDMNNEFYETIDRNGRTAYVLKKSVKLIYKDSREQETSISPFKTDPTDYSKKEIKSLSKKKKSARLSVSIGIFNKRPISYPYKQITIIRQLDKKFNLNSSYSVSPDWDKKDIFHFGITLGINYVREKVKFMTNDNILNETHLDYSLGPFISYDFIKSNNFFFNIYYGPSILFKKSDFYYNEGIDSKLKVRSFSTFLLSSDVRLSFNYYNFIPKLSFFITPSIQVTPKSQLKTNDSSISPANTLWDKNSDKINLSLFVKWSLLFGINIDY